MLLLPASILLSGSAQAATLKLTECSQDKIMIVDYLQSYKDSSAAKTLVDIQQLPETQWQLANSTYLAPGFTRAAYWYRLSLENTTSGQCRLWLDLGTMRVTDAQIYSKNSDSDWSMQRVGVAYPLEEWGNAQRVASLPVTLPASSATHIVFRISSTDAFTIEPQLLSQHGLTKARMAQSLIDGVVFGILGLLIVFSVLISYLYRLRILLVLTLSVLFYTLYTVIVAGYGFIYVWPHSPQWNAYSVMVINTVMSVFILGYLRILLCVNTQPKPVGYAFTVVQSMLCGLLLLRLMFPFAQWLDAGSFLSSTVRFTGVMVIFVALYRGARQQLPYNWFSYAVSLFLTIQSASLLLFFLGIKVLLPLEHLWLTASALPGGLMLSYTLISQVALGRQREELALVEIEQLKQAEHEILEQRVELRTQQLRDALRNQNMLLARISHDLRSPLQQVIRDVRLLQESNLDIERYGHSIERAVHQQLELIDELLEFSHGELKQLELLIAPGYLFGFLREIEETGVFLAERNHNSFHSELANDLPLLVNADFRRLRQVIINLLANATKFTDKGQIKFSVSLVTLDKQAGYANVRFIVEDTGIGMPQEEREHLLQPFLRGENSASYEGVGLGLYIVRQLLDSMQSQLKIDQSSSGGVRCDFTVRLELATEQELDQVFIESYSASSEGQQGCVLIVDDIAITQEMLYELLSGYNYMPIMCSSAAEALIILRDNPVDIVITDQVMPVMDGWDLLRNIRKEWPDLPVLLYSARPPVRPAGLDPSIEFDGCLLKPATTGDLLAQIKQLVY